MDDMGNQKAEIGANDRINIEYDWEVCTWARYFNTSERRVKEAVAAVGASAVKVREHLRGQSGERPSAS
jgi:hypothetical protein